MIRKVLEALRVGAREARRFWVLETWAEPGGAYLWPHLLTADELVQTATRLGLSVAWVDRVWCADPLPTLWRLTLDLERPLDLEQAPGAGWRIAGDGTPIPNVLAGVAVCTSHDAVREVIVLEPFPVEGVRLELEPTA